MYNVSWLYRQWVESPSVNPLICSEIPICVLMDLSWLISHDVLGQAEGNTKYIFLTSQADPHLQYLIHEWMDEWGREREKIKNQEEGKGFLRLEKQLHIIYNIPNTQLGYCFICDTSISANVLG